LPGAAPPHSLYYFHHLLAGPLEGWPREFERIAALGFDGLILAPPFATGRDASVFLAADHGRLHAALGGAPALEGIAHIAEMARAAGLTPLLDLTTDRLDSDAALLREHPDWALPDPRAGLPPDPRQEIGAGVRLLATPALRDWWRDRMAGWASAGIAGFRCLDAGAGGAFWGGLIRELRDTHPELLFIAWTQGLGAAQAADLEGRGFDLVSSSLPWWDYRAAWLGEEAERLTRIAPLLSMPETPFARRLAATSPDRRRAEREARRALRFAALSGAAWLMPMGFEFGDLHRMGHGTGQARDFAALRDAPRLDLREAVREANEAARLQGLAGKGALLSGPGSPVALLGTEDALLLANPSLSRAARIGAPQLLTQLPRAAAFDAEDTIILAPGEVRRLAIRPSAPIILKPEPARRGATAAADAPRIAIEAIQPVVDAGRFPVKRIVGHTVTITADVFTDGATKLAIRLFWRPANEKAWREVPMQPVLNDSHSASFVPERVGRHLYTVCAWVDFYAAFLDEITKKHAARIDIALERQEGMALLEGAKRHLPRAEAAEIAALLKALPRATE
jgi:starch synthase (maltosyl-transferring)